jgi:hypothetical protein
LFPGSVKGYFPIQSTLKQLVSTVRLVEWFLQASESLQKVEHFNKYRLKSNILFIEMLDIFWTNLRELALAISLLSLGSSQIFFLPHLSRLDASRFWSLNVLKTWIQDTVYKYVQVTPPCIENIQVPQYWNP